MTIIQKLRASLVIRQVAKQQGISTSQCRSDIQEAITAAWATSDPEAKHRQIELVGEDSYTRGVYHPRRPSAPAGKPLKPIRNL